MAKQKKLVESLSAMICAVLGIVPGALAFYFSAPSVIWLLVALNALGWYFLGAHVITLDRIKSNLYEGFLTLEIPFSNSRVDEQLEEYLDVSQRYHRASYALRKYSAVSVRDLGIGLRKIVDLAYEELAATSVELALFDTGSGKWSQVLIAGEPTSVGSQSMLLDASSAEGQEAIEEGNILLQPMLFSDTLFGALRVELPEGRTPSEIDRQVAYLLATQGAILLVDAQFTEELLRMRKTSEESVKAKTGFLANLSHELRGPLSIILNSVELIKDGLCGPISDELGEMCGMINTSADHLLDLVNDVLDYAKAEAGKVKVSPVDLGLKDLLTDLCNVVRSQAMAKGHKLILEPVEVNLGMSCDKRHARQMIINFLTNAIKYTPDGGKVTVRAEIDRGDMVRISVEDTGVGIPESQKEKVFGAFERVEGNYAEEQMGTGLGMPLTKKLAEVNAGEADFESEEGHGSTFWIKMPLVYMDTIEVDENAPAEDLSPQGRGERILLLAPNQESQNMHEKYLVHQGFSVEIAANAGEAIKLMNAEGFDLALVESDSSSGQESGENLISTLRANPRAQGLPIILLSAKAFEFDVERFLKLGVDRCLSKPVQLTELAITTRRLIDEAASGNTI